MVSVAGRHDGGQQPLDAASSEATDPQERYGSVKEFQEAIRQYREEERRDKADRKQYRAAKRRLARRKSSSA